MIIPDINLLIYAYDSDSKFHSQCKAWWQQCLSGTEPVGLPDVVIFGFLRITTNSKTLVSPLSVPEALTLVRSWLEQPCCKTLDTTPAERERTFDLLKRLGTAGNLVSDAQIVAVAIEHRAVLHTNDTDFIRFQELKWHNPITKTGSRNLRNS